MVVGQFFCLWVASVLFLFFWEEHWRDGAEGGRSGEVGDAGAFYAERMLCLGHKEDRVLHWVGAGRSSKSSIEGWDITVWP